MQHIAIAGNIGSGKSTLTRMLAKHYGWEARFEAVEQNPYLDDYYKDIHRWSFNLEVFFLKERFRDLIDIHNADHTIVQDRMIYEGVYVFMQNNKEVVTVPDLMIYLRASVPHLVGNIQKRGRDYEQQMQLDYLENLNKRYDDFIFNKYKGPVVVVDKDELDFEHNPKDFAKIIDSIDQRLFGLFTN